MCGNPVNDTRTDETNEADEDHEFVEKEHTTAPMVPIKKVLLALRRLKDLVPQICFIGFDAKFTTIAVCDMNKARSDFC